MTATWRTAALLTVIVAAPAAQTPRFDAISIKHNTTDNGLSEFQMRPGGRLVVSGLSLRELVLRAYGTETIRSLQQIAGGPDWVRTDRFDVTAVTDRDVDGDQQSRQLQMLAMLRSALEDRFQLRVHTEQRPTDVYSLVLSSRDGTRGPGLHPSTVDCPVLVPGVPRTPDPVRWCGLRGPRNGVLVAQGVPMNDLANLLASFSVVGRPVTDRTGLVGGFDFQIPFDPSFVQGQPVATTPLPDSASHLFTALQEQLGLRLQSDKAPIPFVVIDRVERPSEN